MREDEVDEILRASQPPTLSPPRLGKDRQPRHSKVAALTLALVLFGLAVIPIVLALTGDPFQLLLGFAVGEPFGF